MLSTTRTYPNWISSKSVRGSFVFAYGVYLTALPSKFVECLEIKVGGFEQTYFVASDHSAKTVLVSLHAIKQGVIFRIGTIK